MKGTELKCIQPISPIDSSFNLDSDSIYKLKRLNYFENTVILEGKVRAYNVERFELVNAYIITIKS